MSLLLRRHVPFYLAAAVALAAALLAFVMPARQVLVIAANLFFAVYLALTLASLRAMTAAHLKKHAADDDVPVWIIFLVTFAAVVAALGALFVLINQAGSPDPIDLLLALTAVPLGWFTIHMMTAIHYAHVFWQPSDSDPHEMRRGLDFPQTKDPAGIDFVYFAFVTGMTAQTSDVDITTRQMRTINLLHAIVSFFFNTVLVAAAVNVAVNLGT